MLDVLEPAFFEFFCYAMQTCAFKPSSMRTIVSLIPTSIPFRAFGPGLKDMGTLLFKVIEP